MSQGEESEAGSLVLRRRNFAQDTNGHHIQRVNK
jgi:hypothetical protein